jgi:hypothetical protein
MEVLSRDMEAFLNRLVHTAGGNVVIVQAAIDNLHRRSSNPTAEDLIKEVVRLRKKAHTKEAIPA